ncbi:uncharacterized protein LOC122503266 [Leptopilina heterotoma]|uniref:uncharacterized protein LOC122503266 n=1 Tax=Leptopilina heterotoma TaxID=63436 RepID=UPI001CA9FF43|nr:uncharacterized protein LOC122503266 [Leptopilina heterotoma]
MNCSASVFISKNIFIPELVKSYEHHLDDQGYLLPPLLLGLRYVHRPYQLTGQQLQTFLQSLRHVAESMSSIKNENSFTDEAFESFFPVTKEQFQEIFRYCEESPVPRIGGFRYVSKKDLLMFLCKLRHGLSDEFLSHIFQYSTRQATSLAVATVRESLMMRFVPTNIGFDAITREDYMNLHVSEFTNNLYNSQPNTPRVIAIIDATYTYIDKSSNFRSLRQSYCVHKGQHLVKPYMIVAPDGYILAIQGPYFSDSRNNDASILRNEFEKDADRMRHWFQENDIVIVDRGYRDATELLEQLGIVCKMTAHLERGRNQLSTKEANASRLVTKQRWVVEARNGHIKLIFKIFANLVQIQHVPHVGNFYRIAGAIINRYRLSLIMRDVNADLAQHLLEKVNEVNVVQALVEVENLHTRNAQRWIRLDAALLNDFSVLTIDFLRDLTVGTYQIKLSPSYIQDKLARDNDEEFQIKMLRNEERTPTPGFIRVRVFSRFRNAGKYQLWVSYRPIVERDQEIEEDYNPIDGYYCTCKSGSRTIGTCAHVARVLCYLGHARYIENVRYPSLRLVQTVEDAQNRPQ